MQSGRVRQAEAGAVAGTVAEAVAEAAWPLWQNPLPSLDRRGHNNDCHLRMCRTWQILGDIGKLRRTRGESVHCVCVFITEMSNYLTKDLGFAAGSVVSFNKLLTRQHVKVSRAWR